MILSWSQAEAPAGDGVLNCSKLAISFYGPEGYLGAIAWINLATGEYETRVRDPITRKPLVVDNRYVYQSQRINPHTIRAFMVDLAGQPLQEVSLDYVVQLAELLGAKGNVVQNIELVGDEE